MDVKTGDVLTIADLSKKGWQERDYSTSIKVAGKIPQAIIQEDPKLLMWYDKAVTRMGGE